MRVDLGGAPVPWRVVTGGGREISSKTVADLLRPYATMPVDQRRKDRGPAVKGDPVSVPAWAFGLVDALWYDRDASKGLASSTIRAVLEWTVQQDNPVEVAGALITIHLSESTNGQSANAIDAYTDGCILTAARRRAGPPPHDDKGANAITAEDVDADGHTEDAAEVDAWQRHDTDELGLDGVPEEVQRTRDRARVRDTVQRTMDCVEGRREPTGRDEDAIVNLVRKVRASPGPNAKAIDLQGRVRDATTGRAPDRRLPGNDAGVLDRRERMMAAHVEHARTGSTAAIVGELLGHVPTEREPPTSTAAFTATVDDMGLPDFVNLTASEVDLYRRVHRDGEEAHEEPLSLEFTRSAAAVQVASEELRASFNRTSERAADLVERMHVVDPSSSMADAVARMREDDLIAAADPSGWDELGTPITHAVHRSPPEARAGRPVATLSPPYEYEGEIIPHRGFNIGNGDGAAAVMIDKIDRVYDDSDAGRVRTSQRVFTPPSQDADAEEVDVVERREEFITGSEDTPFYRNPPTSAESVDAHAREEEGGNIEGPPPAAAEVDMTARNEESFVDANPWSGVTDRTAPEERARAHEQHKALTFGIRYGAKLPRS